MTCNDPTFNRDDEDPREECINCGLPRLEHTGWKTEVETPKDVWTGNGIVWPDEESALRAGRDLLSRWFVPTDYRAVETDETPNRPTWDEHVAAKGLPPRSVQL